MNVSALKKKFYKVYDENFDYIENLANYDSNGLSILDGSYLLLDYYFNNYKDQIPYDEDDKIMNFFSNESVLEKTIDFFIERIDILLELNNQYNDDDFEEILPIVFYKLKFEELLDTYKEELEKNNLVGRIENTIKELKNYIENGIFKSEEELDEIELELESYMKYVDVTDLFSNNIFMVVNYMLFEDDEEIDDDEFGKNEVTLEFLLNQYSSILKNANEKFGGELLSLKRDCYYYKMIVQYKKIVNKIIYICDWFEGTLEELSNKIGFDFIMMSVFCTSLYLEALELIDDKYHYLKIENLNIEKFNEYKRYLSAMVLIKLIIKNSDSLSIDQFNEFKKEILQTINKNKYDIPELNDLYEHYENDFLNYMGLGCESIDEFLTVVYQKLSNLCNEYY